MNIQVRKVILFVGAWLILVGHAFCASVPADELVKEANKLFYQFRDREALEKFQMVLIQQPSHYEALFKTSLLHTRIGLRYSDETEKLEYFAAAKGYAEMALKVNPKGADSHYVLALAIHNLSIVSGPKERILNIRVVKRHLEQALEFNPQHAGAWQLLARWHYKVAHFNFLERGAAELLINGVPRGASSLKAIEFLKRSIAFDSQNISGYYDLAIIYEDLKMRDESVDILQDALKLQLVTSEDLELSRRCKTLLTALGAGDVAIKSPMARTQ